MKVSFDARLDVFDLFQEVAVCKTINNSKDQLILLYEKKKRFYFTASIIHSSLIAALSFTSVILFFHLLQRWDISSIQPTGNNLGRREGWKRLSMGSSTIYLFLLHIETH